MTAPKATDATKEPHGQLRIVETRLTDRQRIAVYVTIILEDEAKQRWTLEASAFRFDLEKEDKANG